MIYNVVSMSGGKDSTAMALLAIERGVENLRMVFADTGNEHQQTYDYLDYLREKLALPIDVVKVDFTERIAKKRDYIVKHWAADGVSTDDIEETLVNLKPTGNPMLDLVMWKGRFPSTMAPFCTIELKQKPAEAYRSALAVGSQAVISWVGVRRDESLKRRHLLERDVEMGSWEPEPSGMLLYRPILDWTVDDVFAMHKKHGVEPNPLYKQGMTRVGCMPCINSRKEEVRQIAKRFPYEIDKIAGWEQRACKTSKRRFTSFFGPGDDVNGAAPSETFNLSRIEAVVDWSNTARGGRQRSLIHMIEDSEPTTCSSIYGLCE